MKVLNIDALATVRRKLTYKGVEHPVTGLSVQKFIDNLKVEEDLLAERQAQEASGSSAPNARLSKAIEDAVLSILDAVPSFPAAELRALSVEHIQTILEFVRGDLDVDSAGNPKAPETKVEGDAKNAT